MPMSEGMEQIAPRRKRTSQYPEEVRKQRVQEQTRRAVLARSRALTVLGKRYPEEFEELRKAERLIIDHSSGNLPGD
jgi:3-mercaptopyruvate sulfurtransferase SseA